MPLGRNTMTRKDLIARALQLITDGTTRRICDEQIIQLAIDGDYELDDGELDLVWEAADQRHQDRS